MGVAYKFAISQSFMTNYNVFQYKCITYCMVPYLDVKLNK